MLVWTLVWLVVRAAPRHARSPAHASLALSPPLPLVSPTARPQKTNDPAGFTLVDVMAWGALGHAAAFYLLATSSLSKAPIPF